MAATPGGTRGQRIGMARWDREEPSDSIKRDLPADIVTRLASAEIPGLMVTLLQTNARAQISPLSIRASIRPSVRTDTTVVRVVTPGPHDFIYTPDPPQPADLLRVGGVTGMSGTGPVADDAAQDAGDPSGQSLLPVRGDRGDDVLGREDRRAGADGERGRGAIATVIAVQGVEGLQHAHLALQQPPFDLELPDGHGLERVAHGADALALVLLRADAPADRGQQVGVGDDVVGAAEILLAQPADEAGNVDACRAGDRTRSVEAKVTAVGLHERLLAPDVPA